MIRTLAALSMLVAAAATSSAPSPPSPQIAPFLGEFGTGKQRVIMREAGNALEAVQGRGPAVPLRATGANRFTGADKTWSFDKGKGGHVTDVHVGSMDLHRVDFPEDGAVFRIKPVRSVEALRREALHQKPPLEAGRFRSPDLVDLTTLGRAIHLDIRYATPNNFMGAPMYTQARAFMQRPAAEALARAAETLRPRGFGLLIHDAYRPWYVTWMFWQATPAPQRIFVANPREGSKHNRGCAVDLSMYDLQTGQPVSMPSVYDEMTDRAYPDYPGGSSLQRWHRAVLREAMEHEGFEVNRAEWWHFDYRDWKQYPIGTTRFEDLSR